jgi:hypothetical protein
MADEHKPWERLDGEPTRAYTAFRSYRDTPIADRTLEAIAGEYRVHAVTVKRWSARWQWVDRATAWDDEVHREIDDVRLRTIKEMHARHITIGKVAMQKALQALQGLDAQRIPAGAAARLLELGAKIERDMLTVTPEELIGVTDDGTPKVDPWEALARELGAA